MRVLMVSSLWPPEVLGGAEQYAAALAARLRDRGHDVGVVTAGTAGPDVVARIPSWGYSMTEYASQPRARRLVFHAGDVARPDAGRALGRAIERFRPDVVHSHSVMGMGVGVLTRPGRSGVPHVHTVHDYWLFCQRTTFVRADGTACAPGRCTSCRAISAVRDAALHRHPPGVVVAVSAAVAKVHTDALPWLAARTRVLYNPVEPVTEAARPAPGAGPPTFGFLGQLSATKGVPTLLRAFSEAAIPGARLLVAGRGPEADLVATHPDVDYRGWVDADEKAAILRAVDCLVVPSEWQDPAPLVVNEARARGIPVIGARAGGIPELIAPECEPLLYPAGDVAALTVRLREFAADPARYTPVPAAAPVGWTDHLEGVLAAYADAAAATERGEATPGAGVP